MAFKKLTKTGEEKYVGTVPKNKKISYKEIGGIFRVYTYFYTVVDGLEFIEKYLKRKVTDVIPLGEIHSSFCWMCDMKSNGCIFDEELESKFQQRVNEYNSKLNELDKELKEKKVIRLVHENPYIISLEKEIDLIFDGKSSIEDFKTYFKSKEISNQNLEKIHKYYEPLYNEILNKENDSSLKEAYKYLTKTKKEYILSKLESLLSACQEQVVNKVRQRKPRKKKAVSAEKIVSKVKYKKFDKELNLNSMLPERLVGYTQCIIYDAKYRILKIVYAETGKKFTFKGTTLLNIDFEKSVQKKLRKPLEILPKILPIGKKELTKLFADIKSVEQKVSNGRFSEETMIIKTL